MCSEGDVFHQIILTTLELDRRYIAKILNYNSSVLPIFIDFTFYIRSLEQPRPERLLRLCRVVGKYQQILFLSPHLTTSHLTDSEGGSDHSLSSLYQLLKRSSHPRVYFLKRFQIPSLRLK